MYCGKNKVALSSQHQIAEALLRLMEEKPYQDITICELCRTAGISRQTFYSLFTSRENVVVYTLQEKYAYMPEASEEAEKPGETEDNACTSLLSDLCRGYGHYIVANRAFLRVLAENHIDYLLYDSIAESLTDCDCFLPDLNEEKRQYAADYVAGGLYGVAKRYALQGCQMSEAELTAMLCNLFNGRCFA